MLKRKMLRDIKGNISQFITIFLMVLIGVFAYTGIEAYMLGMGDSASKYYESNNLQDLDVFGPLKEKDVEDIKMLDNVKDAEAKLTMMANIDTYEGHSAELNFIKSNNIANFYVEDGISFDKDKEGMWVDYYYAEKAGIKIGDTLEVSNDNFKIKGKVLGLIMVPDHVYYTKDDTQIFSTHEDFGYIYLSENMITEDFIKGAVMKEMNIKDELLFDMYVKDFNYKDYITYSSIMVDVDKDDNKTFVREKIEEKVENAKVIADIKDEKSYSGYEREKQEGETYVGVFSGLFIFIALLSVVTTMTRVVRSQRTEIGTLKALGFSNKRVSFHYLSYAIFLSLLGSILGLIIGYFGLGTFFLNMEMDFYAVPNAKPGMALSAYFIGLLTVFLTAFITYITTRGVLKQNAADTLRPERPKVKNNNLNLSKINHLNFSTRWNIRDIIRNKARTIMGLIGIAGCSGLFVAGFGMYDSIQEYLRIELDEINHYDYRFNLNENILDSELSKLTKEYGDNTSMSLMIEIKKDDKSISNNAFIDASNGYMQILDENYEVMTIDDDGVYITKKLAALEGYSIGDTIKWHMYGDEKYYESTIIGFNRDPQNQNMSMTKKYLESLGIEYKPDSLYTNKKVDVNGSYEGVSVVQEINAIKDGFNNMISAMLSMIYIIIFFAAVLGAVIIYNMGVLSFTEKDYQFATLKVLGFNNKKISKIFIKQNIWITILAIIVGLPFGYFVVDFMFKKAIGDVYDFATYISPKTYIIAAIGTFVVSLITSYILSLKIRKIDMVKSLKGNE